MAVEYNMLFDREPDTQYIDRLQLILDEGEPSDSYHEEKSLMYMAPPPLRYDLRNGIPLLTARSMKGIWKSAFAEIMGFLNGARTQKELLAYGVNEKFWGPFVTAKKCAMFGLEEGDLGPGSYGPAMAARETKEGYTVNQMDRVLHQLKTAPFVRTHLIDPWIPQYCVPAPGETRQVVVAPCHGWMHFRAVKEKSRHGIRLDLHMWQRSADMPVGVPSNIFQYSALLVVMAHVLNMRAGWYYHSFSDAHIYEASEMEVDDGSKVTQREAVNEMILRQPKEFPTLHIKEGAPTNLFDFRPEHLELREYDPHPPIKGIEVAV